VEIFYNGQWGTICHRYWDLNDANVVCRSLGLPRAAGAPHSAYFGQGTGKIWLSYVRCIGNENTLSQCSHSSWDAYYCGHSEDAGVVCGYPPCKYKTYEKKINKHHHIS
jgi:deleted-in-malignant-brain-tumors protein 1